MSTFRTSNQGNTVVTTLLILIVVILAAGSVWYFTKDDTKSNAPQPNTVTQPSAATTQTSDDEALIKERATYSYNYVTSPGGSRYVDLQANGYITANLAAQAKNQGYDTLTCSQQPATNYTYSEPKVSGNAATLVVTGDYPDSKTVITTTWIKEQDTWKIDQVSCPANS